MRKYPITCTESCPLARENEIDILINAGRREGESRVYSCDKGGMQRRKGSLCLMGHSYKSTPLTVNV